MQPLPRTIAKDVKASLEAYPSVGIIGPRQVGKTTLAKSIAAELDRPTTYLDLQVRDERRLAEDLKGLLATRADHCIILDEIQVAPELFGELRGAIDRGEREGQFILLGSASPLLMRKATDSLAGRIAYFELTPFSLPELPRAITQEEHFLVGGFPRPLLKLQGEPRWSWFEHYARHFVTRDLAEYELLINTRAMERLLSMLAHLHGQQLNLSKLSNSLDISRTTVSRYVDILERAFFIRLLQPYSGNTKKRIVKTPKVYIRDSGLRHSLLLLESMHQVERHPGLGAGWEGYAVEEILRAAPARTQASYYRTQRGAELDLVLERGSKRVAFEIKYSDSPTPGKGLYSAIEDTKPDHTFIVTPHAATSAWSEGLTVINLANLFGKLKEIIRGSKG